MNEKDRLQKLIDWVKAKDGRSISIKIGDLCDNNYFDIWAYDYKIREGKHITIDHIEDIDKIDLELIAKNAERVQYEKLKAKYENNESAAQN